MEDEEIEKLPGCPFCGAKLVRLALNPNITFLYLVHNDPCIMSRINVVEFGQIELWKRRYIEPDAEESL
jgi:hypothetical protein